MDKTWRAVVDKRAREYRKLKAYLCGVEEAGAERAPSPRYLETKRWVWAIESVERALRRQSKDKHRFFCAFYGLHGSRGAHGDSAVLMHLCETFHVSRSTAFCWRQEALSLLVTAATQAGLIRPFETE